MNAEKWHHSEIRIAINDESQGSIQWRIQDFCKGGAAAGAFGVPQAPSYPLSLRPLRKLRGS